MLLTRIVREISFSSLGKREKFRIELVFFLLACHTSTSSPQLEKERERFSNQEKEEFLVIKSRLSSPEKVIGRLFAVRESVASVFQVVCAKTMPKNDTNPLMRARKIFLIII